MIRDTTRRDFLATAGTTAAGFGLFQVLGPRSARADDPPASAAEKPVLGLIGCGGMGRFNTAVFMDQGIPVAAVCDVDRRHAGEAADLVEQKQGRRPEIVKDYRKLLDRHDIDVVIIATPDHWHALNLIHACEAGKDIYCEKPISHNIVEARHMAAAVRRHERIVQVGTWQRSTANFVAAIDFIRQGKLGKVVMARAWKTDEYRLGQNAPKDPPAELDYDTWVGPAGMIPYTDKNCHGTWRVFWNYGAGMAGDWGVHMIDIALLALSPDTNLVMPEHIACYGGHFAYPGDDRTTPDTQLAVLQFPDHVLHWETNRRGLDGEHDHGTQFLADDGTTLNIWRGGWWIQDPEGKELPRPAEPEGMDGLVAHVRDFLQCVESRDQPRADIASMAKTTIVCHLINAAYLAGETVRWSNDQDDIDGTPGKDTLPYRRDYRPPWELPRYA